MIDHLPGFLQKTQFSNVSDYLCNLIKGIYFKINRECLSQLGIDLEQSFLEVSRLDPLEYALETKGKGWSDTSEDFKFLFLDNFIKNLSAKMYGLEISSWRPVHPIESLIQELKQHGPLFVQGCFGSEYYSVPPRKLEKVLEGREVYGWLKSDLKESSFVNDHAILIVGAEKIETRGFVYFIDPNDESDPQDIKKQKIYVMSYERLTASNNISDLHGFLRPDAPLSIGYAYFSKKS